MIFVFKKREPQKWSAILAAFALSMMLFFFGLFFFPLWLLMPLVWIAGAIAEVKLRMDIKRRNHPV